VRWETFIRVRLDADATGGERVLPPETGVSARSLFPLVRLLVDQRHVVLVVAVPLYPDPVGEFVEVRQFVGGER
jgi:hypothetical protein